MNIVDKFVKEQLKKSDIKKTLNNKKKEFINSLDIWKKHKSKLEAELKKTPTKYFKNVKEQISEAQHMINLYETNIEKINIYLKGKLE